MKRTTLVLAILAVSLPALSLDKMPKDKGFSGYANLGVGAGSVESNFLAHIAGLEIDLGDDTIDSFGSPDDEDIVIPALNFELGYTFGNKKTRIALGNDLADFLQFDRATRLSVRHDFDNVGRMQLGLLNSALLQTEVWKDPYLLNEKRERTDYDSNGVRLTWDKILGSHFELKTTVKKLDVDKERSGEDLGLSQAQRKLLDREGDVTRIELGYLMLAGEGKHLIRPSVTYIDRDLDGDAMAQDGYEIGVSWAYSGDNFRWVNNIDYASMDGNKENPIFNEVNDSERILFASQMFFPGMFGLQEWVPNISFAWAESDSDVDFNDESVYVFSASMFRRF